MVVESVDTVSTEMAMKSSLRPEDEAGVAELEAGDVHAACAYNQGMDRGSHVLTSCHLHVLLCSCTKLLTIQLITTSTNLLTDLGMIPGLEPTVMA